MMRWLEGFGRGEWLGCGGGWCVGGVFFVSKWECCGGIWRRSRDLMGEVRTLRVY